MDDLTFWNRVNIREPWECWPWMRNHLPSGYGTYSERGDDGKNHTHYAHREAYERAGGRVRVGEQVHHECGVSDCCNPRHLFAMTYEQHYERHNLIKDLQRYPIEQRLADLEAMSPEALERAEQFRLSLLRLRAGLDSGVVAL